MKKFLIGAILTLVAAVLLGGAAVAMAAQSGPGPAGRGPGGPDQNAGGEVTAVDGQTITAENPRQTETILTDDNTEFIVNGEAGSLADVTVGKSVHAEGQRNDDDTFSATRVSVFDEPPPRPQPGPGGPGGPDQNAGGKVTAVDGQTITAENPRQTETILTDDNTEFIVNGEAGSLADVTVGKSVHAEGQRNDDDTFSATRVSVFDEPPAGPGCPPDNGQGRQPGPGQNG